MKVFRFIVLCSLTISQSIAAQEKKDVSFRDFIGLLKNGQVDPSLCDRFLHRAPYADGGDTLTVNFFLERPNYAAILVTSTKTSYYSEARPVETFDSVETYDWDGNKLDSFEYGYNLDGGFHEKSIRSEINEFDEIKRTTHFTEVKAEPVNTDIPGNPQYNFRTVRDTTYTERFRISEKGLRENFPDISFRDFIEIFRSHQADSALCQAFFHSVPHSNAEETLAMSIFLDRPGYIAILTSHTGEGTETINVNTYGWDGKKLDSFEYGYEYRGGDHRKSIQCEINDQDVITRTTRAEGGGSGEINIERYRISEYGMFERVE
jgi:hypothetical protein